MAGMDSAPSVAPLARACSLMIFVNSHVIFILTSNNFQNQSQAFGR